jgi:hypothetical protein
VRGERICGLDIISAPFRAADMVIVSNLELGAFISDSFKVARKTYAMVLLDLLVSIDTEHMLGFEIRAVFILEFRDLDLSVRAVLQRDCKILAIGHVLSPLKNELLVSQETLPQPKAMVAYDG